MSTFAIQLCATGHENVLSAHQPSSITRPLQAHPVRPLVFTFLQRTSDRPLVLYCFVEALWKVWRKLNGKIKDPASDFVFLGRLFSNTMLRYVGFSWPGGELREYSLYQCDDCIHIIALLKPLWTLDRGPTKAIWPVKEALSVALLRISPS